MKVLFASHFMKVIRKMVEKMKDKMYCYQCDKNVTPITEKKENKYIIHKEEIIVKEDCYKCPNCEEELIDETLDESLTAIYNEYLKKYNLSISELKEIRRSLNLSQELFAASLGWSKKTITRYENGQSLPQKEYLIVYQKLKENKDEILNILECNKLRIKEKYDTILKKVSTNIELKTIHTFLYLLEENPLYETQIMKNLFAVDFETQKERNHPLTSLQYAHAPYGPIIDDKDEILNYLIKNSYIQLVGTNDDKIKFISVKKYDPKLFAKEEISIMNRVKTKLRNKTSKELSEWSHNFKGWKDTKNGKIISYTKYASYFDLEKGWK